MQTENNIVKKSQLVGGKSVGYLQSVALERDLNQGPPDYTSGTPGHAASHTSHTVIVNGPYTYLPNTVDLIQPEKAISHTAKQVV